MKNLILIMVFMFSTNLIAQPFNVPRGFTYTGDSKYIKSFDNKSEAIDECRNVYEFYGVKTDDFDINENSKVLIFVFFDSDRRNHMYVLYAVKYMEEYDVVLTEIKNKDTYFFSYDDYDGYTYDLIYRKL
tara:strand:- start:62 stop:451 length:390 start_codon:yes stop_codon:yes gene_type:complete